MSSATEPQTLLAQPHHDGSELYVLERPEELGDRAVLRVRVPEAAADTVLLRVVVDGEPRTVPAVVDEEAEGETWWRAELDVPTPVLRYRWLLAGGSSGYAWLNASGLATHEVPSADDFALGAGPNAPAWHASSVVYEIFPDRFASSGERREPPEWAVPREWDRLPEGRGPNTPREWFGGDLRGIEQHLDHIEALGANAVYLTPIFPAGSTHRYDATSFDRVDPLLGGDEAFA
ncbi:MAG TPA: alpha-amylase family glycosyl hydrolase, partial [Gaiellaceae bacterium]